jgi:hypothetical protein
VNATTLAAVAAALSAASLAPPARPGDDLVRFRLLNEALAQAERVSADWDPGQRDCAGFVRFVFRKATGATSPLWTRRDGTPARFVKAEELLGTSFLPLARAVSKDEVETGDVLAFFDETKPPADAFHLMVVLRPPGTAPDRLLVVYHNGASGPDAAVRKVWLDDLVFGPPEWRPSPDNPRFLGVFRWSGFAARPARSSR